jgi:hypothetical protein
MTYAHVAPASPLCRWFLISLRDGFAKSLILNGLILIKKRATHPGSSFYKDLPRIFNSHPQTYPQDLLMSGFSSFGALD